MNWLHLKTPLKIRTRLVLASALQLGLLLALLAWQQAAEQAAAQGLQAPLSAAQADALQQASAHAHAWLRGLAIALMGLCLWLAYRFDRAVRRPLRHLQRWTAEMSAGNLGSRSGFRGGCEFAELSEAMDQMAATVAQSMQQLRDEVRRRQAAEATLHQLAYHDALTGLPTQRLLQDRLDGAIARARRQNRGFTLMFLDLDHFKPINDRHGHDVGDRVLQAAAKRLSETVRECDTVARVGGDEFVLLLPELADAQAAQDLRCKLQQALARPLTVCGCQAPLRVQASVGIAQFPTDSTEAEGLLRLADHDMYRSKQARHMLARKEGAAPTVAGELGRTDRDGVELQRG